MGMLLRRHYETLDEPEADVAEEEMSLTPIAEGELSEEAEPEEGDPEEAEPGEAGPGEVSDGDAGARKGKA